MIVRRVVVRRTAGWGRLGACLGVRVRARVRIRVRVSVRVRVTCA